MAHPGERPPEAALESLFVWEGGALTRVLERLHLVRQGRLHAGRAAAVAATLTWVPLLILAAAQGVAWGGRVPVPFLEDFLPYGQFFLSVPMLWLGDLTVGRRLAGAMAELRRSDVLAPEDTSALDALLKRVANLWRGRGIDLAILLLTLAATGLSFWGVSRWLSGGWQLVDGKLTLAGWWYVLVSAPVLRFLTLRWVWRLALWAWILWRLAGMKLRPAPAHPDRAGGLAFLGVTQASFGVLVSALSVQLSCLVADGVHHQGVDLVAYQGHVTAFVLLAVTLLVLPLLPFAPRLVRARAEGLLFLTGTGYDGAVRLEKELEDDPSEVFAGGDISALADFGTLFDNTRAMKPLPLDLRHVVVMVLSALVPFLPLVFLVMPAQEVFKTLRQLVL